MHAWNTLFGGECIEPLESVWAEEFTIVDCAAPHAAQLVLRGTFPGDAAAPFPGEAELAAQLPTLCRAAGVIEPATVAGIPDMQVQFSYPVNAEQWDAGERTYYCFANRAGGEPMTGSHPGPRPGARGIATPMPASAPLVVFGSLNVDSTSYVASFPAPGETILAHGFRMALGGKGTNQAVAAHVAGATVELVARIGDDAGGDFAESSLERLGVSSAAIARLVDVPTGVAQITVADSGENTVIVTGGANHELSPSVVDAERARIAVGGARAHPGRAAARHDRPGSPRRAPSSGCGSC